MSTNLVLSTYCIKQELSFQEAYNQVLNFQTSYKPLLIKAEDLINIFSAVENDSDNSLKKTSSLTAARIFLKSLPLTIPDQEKIIKQNEQLEEELKITKSVQSTLENRLVDKQKPNNQIETSLKKEIEKSKQQINNLNAEISNIKSNNNTSVNAYKEEIKKLEVQITNQEKELLNAKEKLKNNNLEIEKKKEDITAAQKKIVLLEEQITKLSSQNILDQLKKKNLKTKLIESALSRKFPNLNYKNEPLNEYLSGHEPFNKHPEKNTELKKSNQFEHTSIPTKQLIFAVSGG